MLARAHTHTQHTHTPGKVHLTSLIFITTQIIGNYKKYDTFRKSHIGKNRIYVALPDEAIIIKNNNNRKKCTCFLSLNP